MISIMSYNHISLYVPVCASSSAFLVLVGVSVQGSAPPCSLLVVAVMVQPAGLQWLSVVLTYCECSVACGFL